jgi:hypothetical protein
MSSGLTLQPTGSLTKLMDEVVALEENVHDDLRVYRWRPYTADAPCIWNWLTGSPFTVKTNITWRDDVNLVAVIALNHVEVEQDMSLVEEYVDAFRDVVDDALWQNQPLNNTAKRAQRTSMNMAAVELNGIPLLCVELPLTFQLDRLIVPSP